MQLALHGGCGWAYGRHDDRLAGDELHIHAPARVLLQRVEFPCLDTRMNDTSADSSGHGLMLAREGAAGAFAADMQAMQPRTWDGTLGRPASHGVPLAEMMRA